MKLFAMIISVLYAPILLSQTIPVILPSYVWVAHDSVTGVNKGEKWQILYGDTNDILDDTSMFSLGIPTKRYRGWSPIQFNWVDTIVGFYFDSNSIHPCKDSGVVSVRHYIDLYDNDNVLVFKTTGVDDPCHTMNVYLRKYLWVKQDASISEEWWEWWIHRNDQPDTTDTTSVVFESQSEGFTIFPNPASDLISIQGYSGVFEVCDLIGNVVCIGSGGFANVGKLPNGLYIVSTKTTRSKVVISR